MKWLPILLLVLMPSITCAQHAPPHKKVKRWPIWYTPSKADVINGITLSPIESIYFFKQKHKQELNGFVIHGIGVMVLAPLAGSDPNDNFVKENKGKLSDEELIVKKREQDMDTSDTYLDCNGIMISGSGTITRVFNGVDLSPWCGKNLFANGIFINGLLNLTSHLNGIAIAAFGNSSFEVHGVQIGLFNSTHELRGLQIGLVNSSKDRWFPIVNWGFKQKNKVKNKAIG